MKLTPTFNFAGSCREAILLYEKAFNGRITCLMSYRDANDPAYAPLLTEEQKDFIYHAELMIGDERINMSDQVDADNEAVAQRAAKDVIDRFGDVIMQERDREIVVRVIGAPEIGMPDEAEEAE